MKLLFWRHDDSMDRADLSRAKNEAEASIERSREIASEADEVARRSAELRESNGFAEAIFDMMFPGQHRP
ncbi:hypothetical protein GTQ99_00140 [Kineococcus sp. T13]|uniref:DUF7620 family protein n=1 Tax=Kineococcus vitellinus TaxID=2696565 RepID=UPI001412536A|nr:hypothetical protein [Kineococcus vitellinus]NAZ73839.1 hypothetical protein [Kineococcus vitellinus]